MCSVLRRKVRMCIRLGRKLQFQECGTAVRTILPDQPCKYIL